ncbi:2-aminoethylphosphonate ABC transporter substrate-binding protein [Yinghuangia seranimata]|uniref:2-aminoethylphosphonate ABC transporter substrate-binding protein n=1 Tax=Yinghuangia seranimata TaxID=408067 RepID=UPI00248ACA93|nr:2-aminoethylphosphonate ABC transporter substrate-binding protein [Yinghuangia seranimata]MDI2131952.1 2-aminoethylphosphonate ABC transporter substrate-binding protein [Yinghuangia seranimata]
MRRFLGTAAIAGAVALTASACGGTGSSSSSDSGAKPQSAAPAGNAPACAEKGFTGAANSKTVTVYSVDGLGDWYTKRFAEFEKQTGIKVQMVESGSGEVVTRMEKEKSNVQADLAVTLPPFIQRAAAADMLAKYTPACADKVPAAGRDTAGMYTAISNNYLSWIYNPDQAKPAPTSFKDLLDDRFNKRLQYSTPGQAGDGTAVLLELQHVYGKDGALEYLKQLEKNNVGPSSSTGKLQPKTSKGELSVANGDIQMNLGSIAADKSNFKVWIPADDTGKKSTVALPYYAGVVKGAPHADAAQKLLDFLLSTESQSALSPDARGLPSREDVKPTDANAADVAALLQGVEVYTPDWNQVVKDFDADIAAYNKAVGR